MPNRRQAIIWTNADPIHWYGVLGRNELKVYSTSGYSRQSGIMRLFLGCYYIVGQNVSSSCFCPLFTSGSRHVNGLQVACYCNLRAQVSWNLLLDGLTQSDRSVSWGKLVYCIYQQLRLLSTNQHIFLNNCKLLHNWIYFHMRTYVIKVP